MNDTFQKVYEGGSLKSDEPNDQTMDEINCFTVRTLNAEDVYLFKLAICDNDIDRDIERFTESTLHQFSKMFIGKSVIFDHDPKASNQTARVYRSEVEETEKSNQLGTPIIRVIAYCYMPKTAGNEELRQNIDAGITKEVSVGVSVAKAVCSICGKNRTLEYCTHRKGEKYDGRLCYVELAGAKDAYEISFVAIPAQRAAGVVKQLNGATTQPPVFVSNLEAEKIKTLILEKV